MFLTVVVFDSSMAKRSIDSACAITSLHAVCIRHIILDLSKKQVYYPVISSSGTLVNSKILS